MITRIRGKNLYYSDLNLLVHNKAFKFEIFPNHSNSLFFLKIHVDAHINGRGCWPTSHARGCYLENQQMGFFFNCLEKAPNAGRVFKAAIVFLFEVILPAFRINLFLNPFEFGGNALKIIAIHRKNKCSSW